MVDYLGKRYVNCFLSVKKEGLFNRVGVCQFMYPSYNEYLLTVSCVPKIGVIPGGRKGVNGHFLPYGMCILW